MTHHAVSADSPIASSIRSFDAVATVALVVVALAWRLYLPASHAVFDDESFTWQLSQFPLSEILTRSAYDVHPPLYYVLLKGWTSLFGPSVVSTRALSACFGGLSAAVAYWLLVDAGQRLGSIGDDAPRAEPRAKKSFGGWMDHASRRFGPLLFSLMVGSHFLQVFYGRTARMYAQGVLLALVSAWLLVRVRGRGGPRWLPWLPYGVSLAAFLYTHHFAWLTLLAQVAYVLGRPWLAVPVSAEDRLVDARWRADTLRGVGLAVTLYSFWLPVLWMQGTAVRQDFWVPPLTLDVLGRTVERLVLGIPEPWSVAPGLLSGILVALVMPALRRPHAANGFFLSQFCLPWLLIANVSVLTARPLFLERTLLFSQVAFSGWLAAIVGRWRWPEGESLAAAILLSLCWGTLGELRQLQPRPPVTEDAVRFVQSDYRPGDVIVLSSQNDLFCWRCHARELGFSHASRCVFSPFRSGDSYQLMGLALNGEDIVESNQRIPDGFQRMWAAGELVDTRRDDMRQVGVYPFEHPTMPSYYLVLYERTNAADSDSNRFENQEEPHAQHTTHAPRSNRPFAVSGKQFHPRMALAARSIVVLPSRLGPVVIGCCLLGTVCFHATHLGQAHTHFNWLAGGPRNGWRHLALSNVDWGQSTYRMADWARSHPELQPLTVVFVSELGEPSRLVADLPVSTRVTWDSQSTPGETLVPLPGWYLLSAEQLTHRENGYFRRAAPVSWPFADVVLSHVPESTEMVQPPDRSMSRS